jgi:hypothetical protein
LKKISAILLSAIMMLYSIGFYFIYQSELTAVKQSSQKAIESGSFSNDLTTIRVAYSNNKIQDDALEVVSQNEISWHGKMYDIVSSHIEGSTVVFSCFTDSKETSIIGSANDHIQKQADQPSGKKAVSMAKNLNLYFEEQALAYVDLSSIHSKWSLPIDKILPAPYYNIPSPPPWNS